MHPHVFKQRTSVGADAGGGDKGGFDELDVLLAVATAGVGREATGAVLLGMVAANKPCKIRRRISRTSLRSINDVFMGPKRVNINLNKLI
jgi:hypothetical protein